MPRRLGPDEKALWGKVMATVKPLHEVKTKAEPLAAPANPVRVEPFGRLAAAQDKLGRRPSRDAPKARTTNGPLVFARGERQNKAEPGTLDSHWDRRVNRGGIVPDISIDLHDASLSRAYGRLDGALEQAIAQKMKVILLVTGKPRAHDRASGEGRGAIAAVVRDWLAASRHSRHISAVRNAHPKHGGAGALYIMLKG
jgi:DNA-nicking Smr family endonuclease